MLALKHIKRQGQHLLFKLGLSARINQLFTNSTSAVMKVIAAIVWNEYMFKLNNKQQLFIVKLSEGK